MPQVGVPAQIMTEGNKHTVITKVASNDVVALRQSRRGRSAGVRTNVADVTAPAMPMTSAVVR